MDLSRGFVTTLVDEGKLNEARREGITGDFLSEEIRPIYNYIGRHYTQYRDVPSRGAILSAFPGFEFGRYKEPHEYFIDGLKESYRRREFEEALPGVSEVYDRDTGTAETRIRELLARIQITQRSFKDVSITETARERVDRYDKRKSNPGADGILSGWAKLDYQTLGWHAEEFVVLVGEKYMGKSWKMLWLAYQAMMQGERVLFITKEMSQEAVIRRLDSIFASVKFDSLRRGELTQKSETRYKAKMEELASSNYRFTVARQGVNTIEDIEAKAVETDSTIIFGDSIYLFQPDSKSSYTGETAKRLAVSQKCKEIAQNLAIPLIASVQAGRKKTKNAEPSLDDIEWSNAFSQDADTVFYTTRNDLDRELKRSQMFLLKSRDGDLAKFFVEEDFEYMKFEERDDRDEPTTEVFTEDEEEGLFQDES